MLEGADRVDGREGRQRGARFEALDGAITIGDKPLEESLPLVSHRVTRAGVEELR